MENSFYTTFYNDENEPQKDNGTEVNQDHTNDESMDGINVQQSQENQVSNGEAIVEEYKMEGNGPNTHSESNEPNVINEESDVLNESEEMLNNSITHKPIILNLAPQYENMVKSETEMKKKKPIKRIPKKKILEGTTNNTYFYKINILK